MKGESKASQGRVKGESRAGTVQSDGRPLLCALRVAGHGTGSGPAAVHAAVESAAVSAVAWSCGVSLGLDGCEVRLCDPCARVRPCVPCVSRVCPGSPRCLFTGT